MIFHALEQTYAVANTYFNTEHADVCADNSVTAPAPATLIKRQRAETSQRLGGPAPRLGLHSVRGSTQAKDQQKRDNTTFLLADYYLEGTDPALLAAQAELAVEAVLRIVDRLALSGGGVYGAGELRDSVSWQMSDGYDEARQDLYWHRAQVTFPVHDRDEQ